MDSPQIAAQPRMVEFGPHQLLSIGREGGGYLLANNYWSRYQKPLVARDITQIDTQSWLFASVTGSLVLHQRRSP
jgi:hypothetical protein